MVGMDRVLLVSPVLSVLLGCASGASDATFAGEDAGEPDEGSTPAPIEAGPHDGSSPSPAPDAAAPHLRSCNAAQTSIAVGWQTWTGSAWGPCQPNFAAVVVLPPAKGSANGTVLLPDATVLDVSGSKTAGLQEAIDYACDWGWDLFVYGAGTHSANGTYALEAPLSFPAMQGKTIRFLNVDLEFGAGVTGSAMTFDSCMMVDLELTGRIEAPSASIGVNYDAASPFPLDGRLGHGSGVTDSRFEFAAIDVRTYALYFTLPADASTFYPGTGSAPTTLGNASNCLACIIETTGEMKKSHLNDTSVTLDPLSPTGVVVIPPTGPLGNRGTVILPGGSQLDVSASQTSGIAEAITYAFGHDLDLAVYGRGLQYSQIQGMGSAVTYPTNGFYQLDAGLTIPPVTGRTLRIYNATLNYGIAAGSALAASRASGFEFELTGQIVAPGSQVTGFAVSSTGGPVDASLWKIGSVGAGWVDVALQTQDTPITKDLFLVREAVGGQYGIMLRSTAGQPIQGNYVRGPHVHGQAVGGVDFQDPASTHTVLSNRFDLAEFTDGLSQWGIGVGGSDNTVCADAQASVFENHEGPGDTILPLASRPPAF